jgi:hypothetical protein
MNKKGLKAVLSGDAWGFSQYCAHSEMAEATESYSLSPSTKAGEGEGGGGRREECKAAAAGPQAITNAVCIRPIKPGIYLKQ